MQLLLSRAGLMLNPGQVADLVLAWRQVAGLIASIPHDRPLADDMASVFRLPPPGGLAPAAAAAPKAPATRRPASRPAAKPKKAKAKAKAKTKARPKRTATSTASKRSRRGR